MGQTRPEDTPGHGGAFVDRGVGVEDRLHRLWAPYRMSYIADNVAGKTAAESGGGSARATKVDPFLTVPTLSDDEGLLVARGELVFCVLNLYPYNSGHMMVVPYRKVANLEDLSVAECAELMAFVQEAVRCVKRVSRPDAINVGLNLGRASGGSVGDHLHVHVVPRWSGDSSFMTVIDGTKVLPQLLKDTRRLLADAWEGPGRLGGGDA